MAYKKQDLKDLTDSYRNREPIVINSAVYLPKEIKIIEDYLNGTNTGELRKKYNIDNTKLFEILKNAGI